MVKICRHLIWVYVVVLRVNEKDDSLQQAALTEQEVRSIFQHAPLPCTQPKPALGKKRLVSRSGTNDADRVTEWLEMTRGVITHKCGVWSGWIDPPAPNHSVQGVRKCPLILVIFCWRLMLSTFHATRNFVFSVRIDSVSTLRASPKCQGFQT